MGSGDCPQPGTALSAASSSHFSLVAEWILSMGCSSHQENLPSTGSSAQVTMLGTVTCPTLVSPQPEGTLCSSTCSSSSSCSDLAAYMDFSSTFFHYSAFSPSFEDFFTEAAPALLTGSAVPCGGGWHSAWISAPLPAAPTHCPFRGKLL